MANSPDPPREPPVHQWGRWERQFISHVERAAPLHEVELTVTLTAPSGSRRRMRAFWDGGVTWRVRFLPDEVGDWTYRTTASDASDAGLHNLTGTFVCLPYAGDNPLYARGAVRVSPSGRYLEHADGTPFFFLADTSWHGSFLAGQADWRRYLADRIAKGFTAIEHGLTPFRPIASDAAGRVPFRGTERIAIDPAFYQSLDWYVAALNDAGLLAVPLVLHAGPDTPLNPGHLLPEDQAIVLARYLVARYGGHHVLWNLVAEGSFRGEGAKQWRRVGRALFDDERHAPVTLHPWGMHWVRDDFRDESWLDVLGYQSGHGDDEAALRWITEGPPSVDWTREPARPLINLEPAYEGLLAIHSRQPFDAAAIRRFLYWSLLVAPTAGVAYGGHGIAGWNDGVSERLDLEETGPAPLWHEALDLPGAVSMRYLADLMHSLPWWRLRPAVELIASQPGEADALQTVVASQTEDGAITLVYLPAGATVTLRRDLLPEVLRTTWFDPRTGERQPGEVPAETEAWTVRAPDGDDWVLVLESGETWRMGNGVRPDDNRSRTLAS